MVRPPVFEMVGNVRVPGRSRVLPTGVKLRAGTSLAVVLLLFFNEISQSLARLLELSYQPKR